MKKVLFLLLFFPLIFLGQKKSKLLPLPKNTFLKIDNYAKKTPSSSTKDIETLANHLIKKAKTDIDKARLIFIWLTENIYYDDRGYNSGKYNDCQANSVLRSRKSVCEGYANLFLELGLEMGLNIKKVSGYSKGYGYIPGKPFLKTDHAWNLIKIGDEWRVFDATWGHGYGENKGGRLKSVKKFNEYWFNVDPYEAIFNHFPDSDNSFVEPSISLKKYEKMPHIGSSFFTLGFDGKEIYSLVNSNTNIKFPETYQVDTHIKLNDCPILKDLKINNSYQFEVYIPRGLKVALISKKGKNWKYFESDNGDFTLNYIPKYKGDISISVQLENNNSFYETILIYNAIK